MLAIKMRGPPNLQEGLQAVKLDEIHLTNALPIQFNSVHRPTEAKGHILLPR